MQKLQTMIILLCNLLVFFLQNFYEMRFSYALLMNLLDVGNLLLALSFKLRKSSEFLIVDKRSDFVVNAR